MEIDGVIKDYEFTLQYYLRKANVIADALIRKPKRQLAALRYSLYWDLVTLSDFNFRPEIRGCMVFLGTLLIQSL